jgi:hypothetical protein
VRGSVAILNYEISGEQLARWAQDHGLDRDRFYLVNLRGRRNPLGDTADRAHLAAELKARQVEALLIDPFGRAYTGQSQIDPGEVGAFLADIDRFARGDVGASDVILSAHAGWNGERTRGASALEDWADSIITMVRDPDDEQVRYLRATGRDVEVDEDRLTFDPFTRTLTLAGSGSRKKAGRERKLTTLIGSVVEIVTAKPGINGSQLGPELRERGVAFQGGDERAAARHAVNAGQLCKEIGKRGAHCYFPADLSRRVPTSPAGTPGTSPDLSIEGGIGQGHVKASTSPGTADRQLEWDEVADMLSATEINDAS